MSARRVRVTLAPEAWDDYHHLLLHTLQQWGDAQVVANEATFQEAFVTLGEHPAVGRARDGVRPGYRSFPVGQHVVFYVTRRQNVRIIRILHRRMDARRAFDE